MSRQNGQKLNNDVLDFGNETVGYKEPSEEKITIRNTGNQPTGPLTVDVSNGDFEITSGGTIENIPLNGSVEFVIKPASDLPVNATPYEATVTVKAADDNDNDIEQQTFTARFTVDPEPTYIISLSGPDMVADVLNFSPIVEGYLTPPESTVTITNTGNQPTGALTVTVTGPDFEIFEIINPKIGSIDSDDFIPFVVRPITGRTARATHYTAKVSVSGEHFTGNNKKEFDVTFTVIKYSIELKEGTDVLSENSSLEFDEVKEGYSDTDLEPKTITITNTSIGPDNPEPGALTVSLGSNTDFEVAKTSDDNYASSITISSISTPGSFKVRPKPNLLANNYDPKTHTAKVTVKRGTDTLASFDVTFTVKPGKQDVSGTYKLFAVPGFNPPGLSIASAIKDLSTTEGVVTIRLTGEAGVVIPAGIVYNEMFGAEGNATSVLRADRAALGYSSVSIKGLLDTNTAKITQYNQGFNMWIKNATGHSEFITNWNMDDVYKEKSGYSGLNTEEVFNVILWNGWEPVASRIIRLEIGDGTTANTFLIDYTDVTFTPTTAEAAAITLAESLPGGLAAGSVSVYGPTVTLTDNVTLAAGDTVTVPADVTLVVAEDKTLTVGAAIGDGAKLDVEEGATVSVSGTLTLAQDVDNYNTNPTASDRGNLKGTIQVESDGIFKDLSYGQGALWTPGSAPYSDTDGTGSITIRKGGKAFTYSGVQMISDVNSSTSNPPSSLVLIKLTKGEFTLKKAEYILNGAATLLGKFGISDDMALLLKAGSTLTIDTIWGTGNSSLSVSAPATITGESGGVAPEIIVVGSNTIAITETGNFYPGGSTTAIISEGTYKWDAAAGGSGKAGWKAE
jgi:hypothetical protein